MVANSLNEKKKKLYFLKMPQKDFFLIKALPVSVQCKRLRRQINTKRAKFNRYLKIVLPDVVNRIIMDYFLASKEIVNVIESAAVKQTDDVFVLLYNDNQCSLTFRVAQYYGFFPYHGGKSWIWSCTIKILIDVYLDQYTLYAHMCSMDANLLQCAAAFRVWIDKAINI